MTFTSIGDLAQSLQMRRQSSNIKTNLDTYANELSSGKHSDIGRELNGNMRILAGIESSLSSLSSFQRMTAHAERHLQDTQTALDVVQTALDQTAGDLLLATNVQDGLLLNNASNDAMSKLSTVIGALNTRSAGQSIFAGNATDTNAVLTAPDLMAAVQGDLVGLTDTGDVIATVNAWFDDPAGGFSTVGYTGSSTPLTNLALNETQSADLSITSLSPEIRDTLKGLVLASLVADDIPSANIADKQTLISTAAETLLSNTSALSALRGRVGLEQSNVEVAASLNSSQQNTLEIGRNDLVLADPFETATQLENARSQLETLYAVTARLSQLKLADFLR